MRILLSFITLVSLSLLSAQGVDLDKSSLSWIGKKLGGQHSGTIDIMEADFQYEDGKLTSGTIIIDMNSITCTDLEGEKASNLVGHLKDADFFEVDAYPEAELNFSSVEQVEGDSYLFKGELTIKGHTEAYSFYGDLKEKEALATLKIDRSKFDVRYGSASFFDDIGDKAIDDILKSMLD